jgi:hypothetical protein
VHHFNVWSTPKNPTNHAKSIQQAVRRDRCDDEDDDA